MKSNSRPWQGKSQSSLWESNQIYLKSLVSVGVLVCFFAPYPATLLRVFIETNVFFSILFASPEKVHPQKTSKNESHRRHLKNQTNIDVSFSNLHHHRSAARRKIGCPLKPAIWCWNTSVSHRLRSKGAIKNIAVGRADTAGLFFGGKRHVNSG